MTPKLPRGRARSGHVAAAASRVDPVTPAAVLGRLEAGAPLLEHGEERVVVERDGWRAWVPFASAYPHHLRVASLERVPDLPSLDDAARRGLAPTDGRAWPSAWTHLELVSPWRSAGVARYVAAGELGGGVLINPVDPDDAAAWLRNA
jgi:UDPglucose--hexose-1-phosphate uridylyltransferase